MKHKEKEIRSFEGIFNLQDDMVIEGAIRYDSLSHDIGFREVISPKAFNKTISDGYDVRCYWSHDTSKVLGRVKNGSLRLENRDDALYFSVTLPDTQEARDYYRLIKDGYVNGVSFGFICIRDTFENRNGIQVRVVLEAALREITICSEQAYPEDICVARNDESEVETPESENTTNSNVDENKQEETPAEDIKESTEQEDATPEPVELPAEESEPSHEEATITPEETKQLEEAFERLLEIERKLNERCLKYGI